MCKVYSQLCPPDLPHDIRWTQCRPLAPKPIHILHILRSIPSGNEKYILVSFSPWPCRCWGSEAEENLVQWSSPPCAGRESKKSPGEEMDCFPFVFFSLNLPSKYWHLCQPPIHLLNNWAKLVRQLTPINLFNLFQYQRISQYLSISIIFGLHITAGRRTEVLHL